MFDDHFDQNSDNMRGEDGHSDNNSGKGKRKKKDGCTIY
jgi:hypothetical protein